MVADFLAKAVNLVEEAIKSHGRPAANLLGAP
jgi:hypothetical protein